MSITFEEKKQIKASVDSALTNYQMMYDDPLYLIHDGDDWPEERLNICISCEGIQFPQDHCMLCPYYHDEGMNTAAWIWQHKYE